MYEYWRGYWKGIFIGNYVVVSLSFVTGISLLLATCSVLVASSCLCDPNPQVAIILSSIVNVYPLLINKMDEYCLTKHRQKLGHSVSMNFPYKTSQSPTCQVLWYSSEGKGCTPPYPVPIQFSRNFNRANIYCFIH